jgi:hypothetical protein
MPVRILPFPKPHHQARPPGPVVPFNLQAATGPTASGKSGWGEATDEPALVGWGEATDEPALVGWGEAADEPALAHQNPAAAAREHARPTESWKMDHGQATGL